MIGSLRTRLALSHVLPILLLIPLLSLYLLHALEDFHVQGLLRQLEYQARLLKDELERFPSLVESPSAAQSFLAQAAGLTDAHMIVVSNDAVIIADSASRNAGRVGGTLTDPAVIQALSGDIGKGIDSGAAGDVVYVALPLQRGGVQIGALRLSYGVADMRARTDELRWLVLIGVILTMMAALVLGLVLATTVVRPLRGLASGASRIAAGDYQARVLVRSHDEIETLARAFNQMAEHLEALERIRERQLSAIIHELARPMTGMRAALETLQDGADADRDMRPVLIGGVLEEMARLEGLLRTLQGVLKRGHDRTNLNYTQVSLQRLVHASVASLEPLAARVGILINGDVPDSIPPICADEDRLIQVLANLLDNAIKFTPRGGSIMVQAGKEVDHVWVRVSDTGIGIAPDEITHVFDEFYSGADSREPEKRGMGLGLAICREIVTAHGGTIRVESDPGQGARFTFTLPA
jgi:signal transduction histidine kinase